MTNSRKLDDLLPTVATKARALISAAKRDGIELLVTSTYRDAECQDALYAQGRTTPGRRVTNAKGGQSWHQYRVAFDVVPLVAGKAIWDDRRIWTRIGELGESVGLEWAGRWKSFPESPHFQFTGGLTMAQLNQGKQPKD
jgi:peptidoglycan LD-endopeptidase CwlK